MKPSETKTRIVCAVVGFALSSAAWHAASAAPAPSIVPQPSVERAGRETPPTPPRPPDAIDRELFGPETRPTPPPGPKPEPKRLVAPAAIVDQMVQSARRLGEVDSGPATQQLQRRIVADLEEILRQAGKAQNDSSAPKTSQKAQPGTQPKTTKDDPNAAQAKPGTQPSPGQAAGGSKSPQGDTIGPGGRLSLLRRVWGDLPERQRDEILQLQPPEEFLPEYEAEIESYFRRLAEGGEGRGERGDARRGRTE